MIHIDLFSGIGGFALAIDEVFPNTEHIFCEIDPFCQQVLKKHWKGSEIYGDIRELTADTYNWGQEVKEQQTAGSEQCDCFLLTGGFPCQPFSQAGKRKGSEDNRFLWPEMLRCIRTFKPAWVIAENVRGILTIESGMVFEQVCLDLEACGYEVQAFIIPAVAKNAPHRRDRVWFVAHKSAERLERKAEASIQGNIGRFTRKDSNATDTKCQRPIQSEHKKRPRLEEEIFESGSDWNRNWLEVATELCGVDDGLPVELDGFKLTKAKHRVERLKSLGNAIVPQVAVQILKAIAISDRIERGKLNE